MPPIQLPIALIGEALVDVFADHEVLGGAPFNVVAIWRRSAPRRR